MKACKPVLAVALVLVVSVVAALAWVAVAPVSVVAALAWAVWVVAAPA